MPEPLYSSIEPLKEIAKLMRMSPGRFKHFRERGAMKPIQRGDKYIYQCTKCNAIWESEDYFDLFSQPCPDCRGNK